MAHAHCYRRFQITTITMISGDGDLGSRMRRMCHAPSRKKGRTLIDIIVVRIDLAKQVFQLHGVDARGKRCSGSTRLQISSSVLIGGARCF